jgi:hypothetical protein
MEKPKQKSPRSRRFARRRAELRDKMWPDAEARVWSRHEAKGFTTLPRTLPLICRLIGEQTPRGDASRVYMDLWFRAFDEGTVAVHDENEMAFTAGYDGPRAVRTWREHIETLRDLGFIATKEQGNRDVGLILLLDPNRVAAGLHHLGQVSATWWNAFVARITEIGADDPVPLPKIHVPRSRPMDKALGELKILVGPDAPPAERE